MSGPVDEAPASVDVVEPAAPSRRERIRTIVNRAATVLAGLLLLSVLVAPGPGHATVVAALRIPVEALLGLALVLAVPARARRPVAALVGVALGLWAIVRIIDVGFYAVLYRPFDPLLDWSFLSSGVTVLRTSMGSGRADAIVVAAVLAAVLLVGLVALSVLRLAGIAARNRTRSAQALGVLGVVWVLCAATGAHLVAGVPVAGWDYLQRLSGLSLSFNDGSVYAEELALDQYRDTPGDELLTALRGKDVVIVLVESYGRVAIEHPEIAPAVTGVLTDGAERLWMDGYGMRSGYLTSPTMGGGSWLAHATLLSGTWVDNQQRYRDVAASDHLPLTGAFRRAGWHTVAVMPGVTQENWPEGAYYAFDEIRAFNDLEYSGPLFGFDSIPDQYVLSTFEHDARPPAPRQPVMAVISLISSHAPWSPVPSLVDWAAIGDGSGYLVPAEERQPAEIVLQRDSARVRADYTRAIQYSLNSVISYLETYGDDDLVLVFLGDHQPSPAVTGATTNRDVPISLVTRDQAVLDRVAEWGWADGLVPSDDALVWRMSDVRDRLLAAFA
jgi:hypothetical protein